MELSSVYLILYVLAWFGLIYLQIKRVGSLGPATMVMVSYFIFGIFAVVYYNTDFYHSYSDSELSLAPFIFLFVMLCLALAPGIYYERADVKLVQRPNIYIIDTFIIIYCICSVARLPEILPNISKGIIMILLESQGGADLYAAKLNSIMRVSDHSVSGIYGLINIVHNIFEESVVFLAFYYLSLSERKRVYVILILMVVLIDMLNSLAKGERNYVMLFSFMLAVGYFMFHGFLENRIRKVAKIIAITFSALIIVPLVAITISRFGDSRTITPMESMIAYAGKAPINFNLYVYNTNDIRYGDRTVNLFKAMLGYDVPANHEEGQNRYSHLIIDDSTFYTFVGDFVMDFGVVGTAILFVILTLFLLYIVRIKGHIMGLHQMLAIYFVLTICAQGGMYMFSFAYSGNWKIIGAIFLYFILLFDYNATPKKERKYIVLKSATN